MAASLRIRDRATRPAVREIADQAFSRTAGAPLIAGNRVELLRDAVENYPAWLAAIASARRYIHFESYIIHEDAEGWKFAEALIAKAKDGVHVRVLYDWMGGLGKTSRSFWKTLRAGGVEVRCYNTPQWDSPFGWQATILAGAEMESECFRDRTYLIAFAVHSIHSNHFLQSNHVGLCLLQDLNYAFGTHPPVQPATLVNVVCGDPEGNHYWWPSLRSRRKHKAWGASPRIT